MGQLDAKRIIVTAARAG